MVIKGDHILQIICFYYLFCRSVDAVEALVIFDLSK